MELPASLAEFKGDMVMGTDGLAGTIVNYFYALEGTSSRMEHVYTFIGEFLLFKKETTEVNMVVFKLDAEKRIKKVSINDDTWTSVKFERPSRPRKPSL